MGLYFLNGGACEEELEILFLPTLIGSNNLHTNKSILHFYHFESKNVENDRFCVKI